ncbi:MAG: hypothetical protein RL701_7985 [Pseudomonadota bacterium]
MRHLRTPVPLALSYGVGLAAGLSAPWLAGQRYTALACLGASSALALATAGPTSPVVRALAPSCLALLCVCLGLCLVPRTQAERLPPDGMARVIAEVEEVRYGRDGHASSRIRILGGTRLVDAAALPIGTHLTAVPFPLPEGARVSLLAALRPALPFRNQTPHPPLRAAHPTRGIAKLASADAYETIDQPWHAWLIDGLRCYVRARLIATLPDDVAAVARAILLGDPDVLDDADAADVRGAGLSHVFAVSGMHVTLLAGLMVWALTQLLLRIPPVARGHDAARVAAGLGIPLALSIAALTGGAPSGWRASITTAIAWAVVAAGRVPDAAAVTAAACLVFAVVTPTDALRPAFLLSIAATAALIGASAQATSSFTAHVRSLTSLTVRTTIATAPVVWWSFGSMPLVGLLANLLLVPVGSLLLLVAALHAVLVSVSTSLAPCTRALLSIVSRAFMRGSSACSGLDPQFTLPVLSLAQGLVLTLGVCAWLYLKTRRQRAWGVALTLLCVLGCEWHLRWREQPHGSLRATFVDVGQGDAAIIDFPNGQVMLIDAGGNPQGGADPGERALVPLLRARRRAQLDVAVLTHPHPDHYGGLTAVLNALPVMEFWDSGQGEAEAELSGTSQQALAIVQDARKRGARVLRPDALCAAPRAFGEAQVHVLAPCPHFDSGFDPNDNSLVLRIDYAGRSLLFTGDIEAHAEAQLVARSERALRADVFKVPHHGSRTSSSEALLRAVRPAVAIVSAGAVNPFGHPHPEVMARLRSSVARVVDIGEHGGTTLQIDPTGRMHIESVEP